MSDLNFQEFESKTAQEILTWALKRYGNKVGLASSFGAEDVVLIDIMVKIDPKAKIFSLDTGRLNQETYNVMDAVREKYGIDIEVYFPDTAETQKMVRENGLNLFYQSVDFRKMCCGVRKVEPLGRALSTLDAWITGLRRDQTFTRANVNKVEVDVDHNNIIKINPIADWSHEQVWEHIKKHNVPYNALHDQGYPSIGCEPCTRPIKPGEDLRAGRWWWEVSAGQKECGLHYTKK